MSASPKEADEMTAPCPDCGCPWDVDRYPDGCPSCGLATEDLDAALEFLTERMPQGKCPECGNGLSGIEVARGFRMGHCSRHGSVNAVDIFRPSVV